MAEKKTQDVVQEEVSSASVPAGVRLRAVPAVRRATAILRHLARHAHGLTVTCIANELDIIPSTCLHILRELVAARLVAFEKSGKTYRLGLGLLVLANGLGRQDVFIQAAQPRLATFAHDHGVSVSAQQRDGDDVVIVAAVTAGEGLEAPLGKRLPLLSAAGGRLFAGSCEWTATQMRAQFNRVRWQKAPSYDAWLNEVGLAKSRGHAVDDGNFRLGITSIAAGVLSRDGSVARAISINVVSAQINVKRIAAYVRALQATSADIASALH